MESNLFPQHAIYIRYPPWESHSESRNVLDRQFVSSANHRRYGPSAWQTKLVTLWFLHTKIYGKTPFSMGKSTIFDWVVASIANCNSHYQAGYYQRDSIPKSVRTGAQAAQRKCQAWSVWQFFSHCFGPRNHWNLIISTCGKPSWFWGTHRFFAVAQLHTDDSSMDISLL